MSWILFLLACASQPPEEVKPSGVVQEKMTKHVEMLSSDDFLGRGTFEPGLDKAAEYISGEFAQYGLQMVPGADSYVVPYSLYQYIWEVDSELKLTIDGKPVDVSNAEWRPFKQENKFTPNRTTRIENADLIFVGYGIDAPEHEWNDYADLDVTGKVVVVMRRKPESIESTEHATFNAKAAVAERNGAVGMIVFSDPNFPEGRINRGDADFRPESVLFTEPVEETEEMTRRFRRSIKSSEAFASAKLAPAHIQALFPNHSLADIQAELDKGTSPAEFPLTKAAVSMTWSEGEQIEEKKVPNVVGMIEGGDPELKKELVIVGAHFDHLGAFEGQGDVIFNGADDNASGTSALLELARLFSEGDKPKRTMMFVAFSAEELGLLGSEAFTKQIDMDAVRFMINFDMIGRNSDKPLSIIGDGFSTEMEATMAPIAENLDLSLEFTGMNYFGASDHDHWYRANRPFLFFFAGLHDDYHMLSDHVEHLDFARMQKTASLGFELTRQIANGAYSPTFIASVDWLGLSLVESDKGVVVHNVDEYGKGLDLGFQVGDVITVQPEDTQSEEAEREKPQAGAIEWLQSLKPEETATLSVKRADQENTIEVVRHKPVYMGVYPGEVSDETREKYKIEEGMGLELGVAEDGPAAKSGFQDGDVLLKIGSQKVAARGESGKGVGLTSILKNYAAGDSVECVVIREGEETTLSMVFGERPKRQ